MFYVTETSSFEEYPYSSTRRVAGPYLTLGYAWKKAAQFSGLCDPAEMVHYAVTDEKWVRPVGFSWETEACDIPW